MDRFCTMLCVSMWFLLAGHAAAQTAAPPRINTLELKKVTPGVLIAPSADPSAARLAPGVAVPLDAEAQVQADIKRQQKFNADISSSLAKVGANLSRLSFTPVTGHSCIDPDTTWNARSGESFTCVGRTTCIGRMSRWSKSRTNPCEPGVVIDSCVISDECKAGSLCNVGAKTCVPR